MKQDDQATVRLAHAGKEPGFFAPRDRGLGLPNADFTLKSGWAPRACGLLRGSGPTGCFWTGKTRALGISRFRRGSRPVRVVVGFTLIEILVVVVIIGVLALAVTIGIATAGGERQLTRDAERLQALINHACTQAELSGREIGVRLDANGYSFALLGFAGWSADGQSSELRPRRWAPGMNIELQRDGRAVRLAESAEEPPQIVCFSSGELSPFLLRLQLGDVPARYELHGEADGDVDLQRIGQAR